MDEFLKGFLDVIADSKDDNDAKENFLAYLTSKNNPQQSRNIVERKIKNAIEEEINEILNNNDSRGDSFILGIMILATIAEQIQSFKETPLLQHLSGLDKDEYNRLVDDIAKELMNKYFE